MSPDIQKYFHYHYDGSGNLQITIENTFLKQLGWSKDLEISFGGIRRMNDWGSDPTLTIHSKNEWKHPWEQFCEEREQGKSNIARGSGNTTTDSD